MKKLFKKIIYQIKEMWYWVRCHTTFRYHMIDVRNKDYGYQYGFIDCDHLIFLACFKILKDFVELQNFRPYEGNDAPWVQVRDDREIMELYNWWIYDRNIEQERVAKLYVALPQSAWEFIPSLEGCFTIADCPERKEWSKAVDKLDKKDQEMLERLIKVRGKMWT